MNKTYLVFRHEFLNMIRRVGFIIMTLIVPLIGILAIVIIQIVSRTTAPSVEVTKVGYVDQVNGFDQFTQQGSVDLIRYDTIAEADKALDDSTIKEYFTITPDYYTTSNVNLYTLEKQLEPPGNVISAIKNFLNSNMLSGKISDTNIKLINSSLGIVTTRLTAAGAVAPEQGGYGNLLIPSIFALLLVLSISFSSVSPRQLIVGKVLGLGAAGLIQVIIWVICAPLLLNVASISIGGFLKTLQISPVFLVLCLVYFILGYLLFAMIMTAVGAITSSAREGQQLSTIFTVVSVSPLWFSSAIILFPNNPAFVVLTIFPLTAPVTFMMRFGSTAVPVWQTVVSITVLALSVIGGLFVTAKIVRTFLLMYGKRPGLGEIIRSIRAA